MGIAVNARILTGGITGLQRYTSEILARLPVELERVGPERPLPRSIGNLWDQLILPMKLNGRGLWSPGNVGPLAIDRQVVTIHDVVALEAPHLVDRRFAAWYRWITPRLVRRVAHVLTTSEFSKSCIMRYAEIDEANITVIPNGVDSRFRPMEAAELDEMHSALSLPSKRYVLCVGSVEPRKNVGRLLEAWRSAEGSLPEDVHLVLAGKRRTVSTMDAVEKTGRRTSRVVWTGHVPDHLIAPLYAGATAFVFPSLYEGFGLPPLEAMACGVPVLSSDRASLPEVVGRCALFVDPEDTDAIASGIIRLVEDETLRAALVRAGRNRAAELTWDQCAERTWSVLQSVLGAQ